MKQPALMRGLNTRIKEKFNQKQQKLVVVTGYKIKII